MSLREVVEKYADNPYNIDSVCKSTMNYIKNALSVFDVSISDFKKIKSRDTYGYNINDELEKILKKYIHNLSFPQKSEISKSMQSKSQLTVEITTVVKNFIEANFNDDEYIFLRKKIDEQMEEIQKKLYELSKSYMDYANSVNKNRLSYMLTHSILEPKLQYILKIDMSCYDNNYSFDNIIDLIHISKQLQDIIKIINRSKSIQDSFETISFCLYVNVKRKCTKRAS